MTDVENQIKVKNFAPEVKLVISKLCREPNVQVCQARIIKLLVNFTCSIKTYVNIQEFFEALKNF